MLSNQHCSSCEGMTQPMESDEAANNVALLKTGSFLTIMSNNFCNRGNKLLISQNESKPTKQKNIFCLRLSPRSS